MPRKDLVTLARNTIQPNRQPTAGPGMVITEYNPFAKRTEFSSRNVYAYKILTVISWLLLVLTGAYYTVRRPADDGKKHHDYRTIWEQNDCWDTPFSLHPIVTSSFWVVTLILQLNSIRYLWSSNKSYLNSFANVGSHYILNNLMQFGFIMCWVRGLFWPGEIILVANLFNLIFLYFRHTTTPLRIHAPVVSFPYAWNYVAIFWDGAAAVNAHNLPARILANVVIWGIVALGGFFLTVFKDWTMGVAFAILSLSLALAQLDTKAIAFQWIFAFVIMGVLFLTSAVVAAPGVFGQARGVHKEDTMASENREREPLLDSQASA